MTVIAFSDLDDTLFMSGSKCQNLSGCKVATLLPDGKVGAYSSPQHQALISLFSNASIIPVTGRRTDSLSRVLINFESYKIASHGAIVLDSNNDLHPAWRMLLEKEAALWREHMCRIKSELEQYCDTYNLKLRVRIVNDKGFACYVCVKGEMLDLEQLRARVSSLNTDGFIVHANNRNLALLPPFASKRRAVAFLKNILKSETNEQLTFIGLGDSLSDSDFMSICDFQMTPSNSQISEILN
jgi:hydroxymethylpyrimidine pyrophosphatase-like HAD family hydrolase